MRLQGLAAPAALLVSTASLAHASEAAPVQIQTAQLEVRYEPGAGRFSVLSRKERRLFITEGKLNGKDGTAKVVEMRVVEIKDKTFGKGQAIDVAYADGNHDQMLLFPNLPFVLFRSSLHNGGKEATVHNTIRPVSGVLDLGKPAAQLKVLGTGGLRQPDTNPGSYMWLAVADPQSRQGVVGGWLTSARGSGAVFARLDQDRVYLDAQIDYGRLRLAPAQTETLETFALGYFDDARLGLEAWADAVARVYDVKLPPQPVGYCTWYHARASNEKKLAEQTAFAAKHLKPFGFSFVQIDDGWQEGNSQGNGPNKNFTASRPEGPYPSGMKAAADDIKAQGLVAGIWFMPFAGTYNDPWFKDRQDWFVKRDDGTPFDVKWGGTCLDMTHPAARDYLRDEVQRITHDWGYHYLKMDGLWTGTATEIRYVNDAYKADKIGNAVFHNPDKTNIEAFRDGLKLVRETAGRDVFLLGCCAPQNMRSYGGAFGLLDAMRIGPDNSARWPALLRGPQYGSRNYHLHRRIWYNDPDPLYVRAALPLNEARLLCSWVTVSGQLSVSSDAYPDLPAERLDLLKRTMPSHELRPRPVDLFEESLPRIWLLTDERHTPRRDVIGLFNWDDQEVRLEYALDKIGLAGPTAYVAFDYWSNALVPPFQGKLQLTLPPRSCAVWVVRPVAEHPQLLSTSRHITQGVVDVLEEKWDAETHTLSGLSRVVAGDAYELRVVTGAAWSPSSVEPGETDRAAGVTASLQEEAALVRMSLKSPESRAVRWKIRFERRKG